MPGISLTPRQRDLLAFIEGYIERNQIGPSFNDMKAGIGIAGHKEMTHLLNALEERGAIRRLYGKARAIEVLRPIQAEPAITIHGHRYRFIPISNSSGASA